MSSELVYTSAARGLNPNTSGFCTVAATQGLARPTQTRLESISGYEFRFNLSDPKAGMNPVNFAHTRLSLGAETRSILSRIAFSGADYSGRTNKIAHHFVLEPAEQMAAGPAWMLAQMAQGVLRTEWTGEPQTLSKQRLDAILPGGQAPAGPAAAWQKAAGDAGWAGMLAKAYCDNPDVPAFVLFNPGTDLLPLFQESLALLPPAERWNVCFATYYTVLPAGCQYHWRGVLAGSAAQQEIKRFGGATVIDLTGPLPPAETNEFTDAARMGRMVEPRRAAKARPAAGAGRPAASAGRASVGGEDDSTIRMVDLAGGDEGPRQAPPAVSLRSLDRTARPSHGMKVALGAVLVLLVAVSAVMGWQIVKSRSEAEDLRNEKDALTGQLGKSGKLANQVADKVVAFKAQAADDARAADEAAKKAESAGSSDDPKKMEVIQKHILEARQAEARADRSARNAMTLYETLSHSADKEAVERARKAADEASEMWKLARESANRADQSRLTVALGPVNPPVTPTKGPEVPVKTNTTGAVTPTAPRVTPTAEPKDPPPPADVAMTAPITISRDEYKVVTVAAVVNEHALDYQVEGADAFVNKPAKDVLPQDFAGIELKYADKQLRINAPSVGGLTSGPPLMTCRVVGAPGKHVLKVTIEDAGKARPTLRWFVVEVADTTKKILYQCPMADRPKAAEKTLDLGFRKGPYQIGVWNRDARKVDFQGRDGVVVASSPEGLSFTYPWPDRLAAFAAAEENSDRRVRFEPKTSVDLESNDTGGGKQLVVRIHIESQVSKENVELTPGLLTLERMKEAADQAWQNNWGGNRAFLTYCNEELAKAAGHIEGLDKKLKGQLNEEERKKLTGERAGAESWKKNLENWIQGIEPQVAPSTQGVREFMDAAERVVSKGGLHAITVRDPWGQPVARMTLKFTPGDVDAYIWKQAPKNPVPVPPKGLDKGGKKGG